MITRFTFAVHFLNFITVHIHVIALHQWTVVVACVVKSVMNVPSLTGEIACYICLMTCAIWNIQVMTYSFWTKNLNMVYILNHTCQKTTNSIALWNHNIPLSQLSNWYQWYFGELRTKEVRWVNVSKPIVHKKDN